MGASIGKFAKQAEACQTDKGRWMERYMSAKAELIQLKKQITDKVGADSLSSAASLTPNPFCPPQKVAVLLQPYLKYKREELEKSQITCRSDHYSKINRIFNLELENSRKAVDLSGDIIQNTYLLLSANMMLNDDMERKMGQLYKLHDGQRGVKFTSFAEKSPRSAEFEDEEDLICQSLEEEAFEDEIRQLSTADMDGVDVMACVPEHLPSRAKRALNVDEATSSESKRFAPNPSLMNVTQVLEKSPEKLSVFANPKPAAAVRHKTTIVPVTRKPGLSRALRETSSNVCKDFLIPKASIKPIINGRAQTPKEKENKRVVVIRKSPRRNSPNKSNLKNGNTRILPFETDNNEFYRFDFSD